MMSEPYSPFQSVLVQNDYQRSRAENFYKAEKNFLVELIRDELEAIENKRVDTVSIMRKRDAWTNVCDRFNNRFSDRPQRSVSQLKECWKKLKLKAKKEVDTLRQERFANPNGTELATPGWLSIVITEMLYPNANILDVMEDANNSAAAPDYGAGSPYAKHRLTSHAAKFAIAAAPDNSAAGRAGDEGEQGGHADADPAARTPDDEADCPESKVDVSIITDNATEEGSTPDPDSPSRPPSNASSFASPAPLPASTNSETCTSRSSPVSSSAYPSALRNLINDSSISCTILKSEPSERQSPKPSDVRSSSPAAATSSRNSPTTLHGGESSASNLALAIRAVAAAAGSSRDPPPYSSLLRGGESALSVALRNPPLRDSSSVQHRPSPVRDVYPGSGQMPNRSKAGSPFVSLDAMNHPFLTMPNGGTTVSASLANGSRNSECPCSSQQCKRKRECTPLTEYEQQMLAIAKEDAIRKARLYDLQMEVLMLKKQKLLKELSSK